MLKPLCRCFIMHVEVWLSDTAELYGRCFYRGSWKTKNVLLVSEADVSGAYRWHPSFLWWMPLVLTLTADTVLYTKCKFDVHEWNCIESPWLTLRCNRIPQISPLKSCSFILPTSNRKPFLSILKLSFISFLSCDDTRKLLPLAALKKNKKNKKEMKEKFRKRL